MSQTNTTTHFGFETIDSAAKQHRVRSVFDSVARKYDIMNDLMSAGLHRLWKDRMVATLRPPKNAVIVDLAGGTGDIAQRIKATHQHDVLVTDINHAMLHEGVKRSIDTARADRLRWACANAQTMPFAERTIDTLTMAFGLRNVTDIDAVLQEAMRVLKPGGQFVVLEFSPIEHGIKKRLYDAYSFNIIPRIGKIITGDKDAYQYLVESIRMFPNAETLEQRMKDAGFARTAFERLTGGVVAIHQGWKI
jgi:demethylmenaquinone methyltransferase/2-methoxy-6-polyprenyl-1,4-benzoquinol methylase